MTSIPWPSDSGSERFAIKNVGSHPILAATPNCQSQMLLRSSPIILTSVIFRNTKKYVTVRFLSVPSPSFPKSSRNDNLFDRSAKVQALVGHNFPDFIEWWGRKSFKMVGNGLIAASVLCAVSGASTLTTASMIPAVFVGSLTLGYWYVGLQDIQQTSHAIRRNYPVIGNLRYIFEIVRTMF
jgi:hypothetical protein